MNPVLILAAAAAVSAQPAPSPPPPAEPVEGRVMLKCMLHEDGTVDACEVERESPEGMGFGQRALELAKRARYNRSNGPGIVSVPFVFPVIDLDAPGAPPPRTP